MQTILTVVQVFLSLGLIGLVLIQHGRGADAGAAFGAGASATVFGARGSGSFLSRATGIIAALFFLTSMALAYYAAKGGKPAGLMESVDGTVVSAPAPVPIPVEKPASKPSEVPVVPGGVPAPSGSDIPAIPGTVAPVTPAPGAEVPVIKAPPEGVAPPAPPAQSSVDVPMVPPNVEKTPDAVPSAPVGDSDTAPAK
jgi:preprotein translocase subunit SecG|nr:preprotein translocase subunit SecG [uncultured Lamprocystis sp.]